MCDGGREVLNPEELHFLGDERREDRQATALKPQYEKMNVQKEKERNRQGEE